MFEKDDLKRMAGIIWKAAENHPVSFAAAGVAGIGVFAWVLKRRKDEEERAVSKECAGPGFEFFCEPEEEAGAAIGGNFVQEMRERTRNFGGTTRSRSDHFRTNAVELVKERPLMAGTAAFLIGMLSGLIVPSSKLEDRVLVSARGNVRQKAEELKKEAKESIQLIAEETRRAAEEEAERHGFKPS